MNFNKLQILVKFIEDKKYDVLRLKKSVQMEEGTDISAWDQNTIVDVLWNGVTYAGNIIQFGENKKEMDVLIDQLADGRITLKDIPMIQKPSSQAADADTSTVKKQKMDFLKDLKEKVRAVENAPKKSCTYCISLKKEICTLKEEKKNQQSVLYEKIQKIEYLESKVAKLKQKNQNLKQKNQSSDVVDVEQTSIGSSLKVPTDKLNMCRTTGYTKFTGDLLEVVFGRKVLSHSVVKGIKGHSKKNKCTGPRNVKRHTVVCGNKI
ncbi:uncharacterized protein LOC129233082 [Uloborus diversus]|uniref:uncharacterized protein LOC129233082 n=1 Tax=Uloborus diversus TaxID=327109 RepID=UPI00240927D4|nr:uncharacterized protein LOC129233082 [Uloborus diversus]